MASSDNVHFDFNLTITQGDDRPLEMIFADAAGAPVDISTWNFFYTVKENYSDLDAAAKISLDPVDFTKSDSGSGTVDKISATISVPASLAAGSYYQDLQKVVGSTVTTIGRGQLIVEAEVTQRTS